LLSRFGHIITSCTKLARCPLSSSIKINDGSRIEVPKMLWQQHFGPAIEPVQRL
jgi:hypothetical protein